MSPGENSIDIFNSLISNSPERLKSEAEDTNTYESPILSPSTPFSYDASASNQTNFTGCIGTAPSSPSSSVNTSFNTSSNISGSTSKRGRGRPAKQHSDVPDLSTLHHLSENEKKKLLERAKNNEASRKSRLKNKERDQALEKENELLIEQHKILKAELQKWERIENAYKQLLKTIHFQPKTK